MSEINKAMINSLNVFTGDKTLEELILSDEGIFVFNPEEPVSSKTLESMLQYFVDVEDYDRCIVVKKLIDDGSVIGKDFRDV